MICIMYKCTNMCNDFILRILILTSYGITKHTFFILSNRGLNIQIKIHYSWFLSSHLKQDSLATDLKWILWMNYVLEICRLPSRACLIKTVMIPVHAYKWPTLCVLLSHSIPSGVCYGNPGFHACSGVGDDYKSLAKPYSCLHLPGESVLQWLHNETNNPVVQSVSVHSPGVFADALSLCGDVMDPVVMTEVPWCGFGWNALLGLKALMHLHSHSVEARGALVDDALQSAAVPQRCRRRSSETVIPNGILELIDLGHFCL